VVLLIGCGIENKPKEVKNTQITEFYSEIYRGAAEKAYPEYTVQSTSCKAQNLQVLCRLNLQTPCGASKIVDTETTIGAHGEWWKDRQLDRQWKACLAGQ